MVLTTPLIAFQLGDKDEAGELRTRHLRITFATLMELELNGIRSILSSETWQALEITEVCTFLASALKHEDPKITAKYVGEYIGPHNLGYIFTTLASAWNATHTGQPEYVPLEAAVAA